MAYTGSVNRCTGNAPGTATATASSSQLLAANASRRGLWIQNTGNKSVFLGFGNAAEKDKGVQIIKDERIQFGSTMMCEEVINIISAAGSVTVIYQEWEAA